MSIIYFLILLVAVYYLGPYVDRMVDYFCHYPLMKEKRELEYRAKLALTKGSHYVEPNQKL